MVCCAEHGNSKYFVMLFMRFICQNSSLVNVSHCMLQQLWQITKSMLPDNNVSPVDIVGK